MPPPRHRPALSVDTGDLNQLVADLEAEIIERRRAEDELRKSEERFRLLAEHARDIVYRYRLEAPGAFEYLSPSVAEITGYTPGEFYRDPGLVLRLLHPEDRQLVDDYIAAGDCARPLTCRFCHRDGHAVWLEQRSLPIYGPGGELAAVEGIARDVSAERELVEGLARYSRSLEEKDRQLREFSSRTIRLQEEERRRVARELHDSVNQLLCAVGFGVEMACRKAPSSQAAAGLEHVRRLVDRSIHELRRISDDLRPVVLDDLGLAAAARHLVDEVARRSGLQIDLHLEDVPDCLPPEIAVTAYRLLQEALLHVERAGGGCGAAVSMAAPERSLAISVSSAAFGTPADAAALLDAAAALVDSLRERAQLAGGAVSAAGDGAGATALAIRFPLEPGGGPQ